jgi:hypothetical protein
MNRIAKTRLCHVGWRPIAARVDILARAPACAHRTAPGAGG